MKKKRPRPIVAIDGPAGAGKSTVAKGVAAAMGYTLVDTGSLYRAVALLAKNKDVAFDDRDGVERATHEAVTSGALRLGRAANNVTCVLIDGEDPGDRIRTPEMSRGSSVVATYPGVREALLDAQRQFGTEGAAVLEGRDIGTSVFPDAEVKIFLTASPQVRARRRFDELAAKGIATTMDVTLREVLQRDEQDSSRAIAPLRQAGDALLIDCSTLDSSQVIAVIAQLAQSAERSMAAA